MLYLKEVEQRVKDTCPVFSNRIFVLLGLARAGEVRNLPSKLYNQKPFAAILEAQVDARPRASGSELKPSGEYVFEHEFVVQVFHSSEDYWDDTRSPSEKQRAIDNLKSLDFVYEQLIDSLNDYVLTNGGIIKFKGVRYPIYLEAVQDNSIVKSYIFCLYRSETFEGGSGCRSDFIENPKIQLTLK